MDDSKFPRTWLVKRLEEVSRINMGQSPPSSTYNTDGVGLPFFQGKAEFTDLSPTVKKWCSKPKKIAQSNDILLSVRAPVGATNIANQKCCIGRGLAAITYHNHKYLFYFLRSIENQLDEKGTGTTFKAISGATLREISFPVPPTAEQERIVAKIEELFSELDAGRTSLETAARQLKTYRQAVLKWAFEGKLTNENVKEGELPDGWKTVKFEEIGNAIDPQPSHRTPPKVENGVPYVSTKDFDFELDRIDFSAARIVSSGVLDEHLERYELEVGDFVIGKIGTIGKPVRIVLPQDYTLSANIVLIQPRNANPTFLYYMFQSIIIEKQFLAGKRATTQAAFGIKKVRLMSLPLPALEEQQRIVEEIETRLSVCDKLEESITEGLAKSEAMRQSILKKAFEGRLVP